MASRDSILSTFVQRSGAEPGLARDILDASNWDVSAGLETYWNLVPVEERMKSPEYAAKSGSNSSAGGESRDAHANRLQERRLRSLSTFNQSIVSAVSAKLETGTRIVTDIERRLSLSNPAPGQSKPDADCTKQQPQSSTNKLEFSNMTMMLPDFRSLPNVFVEFIEEELLDKMMLSALESSGSLNWLSAKFPASRLFPLRTSGDGNCLLHAASLGMWGFHDRLLRLRTDVENLLTGKNSSTRAISNSICRRWAWDISWKNANNNTCLVYTSAEWEREWSEVTAIASSAELRGQAEAASDQGPVYSSLEEVHVFTLAHVLRRPIIVVADKYLMNAFGERIAPIPFSGIYLPLLIRPDRCFTKVPLVLAFDSLHFAALAAIDRNLDVLSLWAPTSVELLKTFSPPEPNTQPPITENLVLPLERQNGELLPIMFSFDPGRGWRHYEALNLDGDFAVRYADFKEKVLPTRISDYLNLTEVVVYENDAPRHVLCANMSPIIKPPHLQRMLHRYFTYREEEYAEAVAAKQAETKLAAARAAAAAERSSASDDTDPSEVSSPPSSSAASFSSPSAVPSGPCRTDGCNMYGSKQHLGFCSMCYQRSIGAYGAAVSPTPLSEHNASTSPKLPTRSAASGKPGATKQASNPCEISPIPEESALADWVDVSDYVCCNVPDASINQASSVSPATSPAPMRAAADAAAAVPQSHDEHKEMAPTTSGGSAVRNLRRRLAKLKPGKKVKNGGVAASQSTGSNPSSLNGAASASESSAAAAAGMSSSSVTSVENMSSGSSSTAGSNPVSRVGSTPDVTSQLPSTSKKPKQKQIRAGSFFRSSRKSPTLGRSSTDPVMKSASAAPAPLDVLHNQMAILRLHEGQEAAVQVPASKQKSLV
eukprot:scpid52090/ scgid32627/ OTU domain-containing protein 7B; Cellular zinc finger anti-NF-kappa-B protein; Zinc finger A20 domain-containing protein 1; Zinc finger protein Cezanne